MEETPLIRSQDDCGEGTQPARRPPEQVGSVPVQERAQKRCLPLRLLNRRRHPCFLAQRYPAPFIAARAIRAHPDLLRYRLALDDDHSPAMHDQVIDLADPGGAILLRLRVIHEPQIVQDVHLGILAEPAGQDRLT